MYYFYQVWWEEFKEIDEEKIKKAKEEFEKKTGMTLKEALEKAKPMETRDLDELIKKKKEADKDPMWSKNSFTSFADTHILLKKVYDIHHVI